MSHLFFLKKKTLRNKSMNSNLANIVHFILHIELYIYPKYCDVYLWLTFTSNFKHNVWVKVFLSLFDVNKQSLLFYLMDIYNTLVIYWCLFL